MDDDRPDPIAQLDQAIAEMTPIAKLLRAHYDTLCTEGFTAPEALRLTVVMAEAWWCKQWPAS